MATSNPERLLPLPSELRVIVLPNAHIPSVRNEVVERRIVHSSEQLCCCFFAFATGDLQAPLFLVARQQLVVEAHPLHLQFLVRPRHIDELAFAMHESTLDRQKMNGEATTVVLQHRQFRQLLRVLQDKPAAHSDLSRTLNFHENATIGQRAAQ